MISRVRILALALLAACSSVGSDDQPAAPRPAVATAAPPEAVAERGIGGTGISPGIAEDRGMGGTGIVGVITGFGSIWVNGIEVEYDAATPVRIDGRDAKGGDLKVGQIAVITASGSGARVSARSIAVRHEVSGPVEAVDADGTGFRVAGQRVSAAGRIWGNAVPKAGDWVAVSGLAGPDGGIVATRIDRRDPGRVLVHGTLTEAGGAPHIGDLALRPGSRLAASAGQDVVVSGRYENGVLVPETVSRDELAADPSSLFGRSVDRLIVESYASAGQGRLRWGRGQSAPVAGTLGGLGAQPQRSIIEFERRPDGGLEAVGLRSTLGRTGAMPEMPRDIGGRRMGPGGLGPDGGGVQGPAGGRERTGFGPAGAMPGEPRDVLDWGGRHAPGLEGCRGGAFAGCGPMGFGPGGHRGRRVGG